MVRGKAKEQAQVCWPLLCAARPMLLPIEEFALTGSRKLSGVLLISLPPHVVSECSKGPRPR